VRKFELIALTLLALVLGGFRLHTFWEPLERDITTYAVIGSGLLDGRELYTDLWDHKPPGVHWTYAIAIAAVGFGPTAIFVLAVLTGVVTLCGIFVAGSTSRGGYIGAVAAGAIWVLLSGDLWLEGNQPNTEAFINSCLVWAFVLLLKADTSRNPRATYLAVGTLFALSSVYKHSTVLIAAVITCAHLLGREIGTRRGSRAADGPPRPDAIHAGRGLAWIAAPGLVAWLAVGTTFALMGGFGDFYDAVFTYNRSYASGALANLSAIFGLYGRIPLASLPGVLAVTMVVAVGCLVDGVRNPGRWLLLGAYLLSACVVIVIPGRFYPHYFLLLLPSLSIGYGWALDSLWRLGHRRAGRYAAAALGTLSLGLVMWQEIPTYSLPAEEWSRQKYGEIFIDSERLGRILDRHLAAGDTFYEVGAETGLYFSSRRSPPSGVLYDYPLLTDTPLRARLTRRVLSDLERTRPALIVVRRGRRTPEPIRRWILSNYAQAPSFPSVPRFEIMTRRDWVPEHPDDGEPATSRPDPSTRHRRSPGEVFAERSSLLWKGPL
jgi:hypothetical protein